MKKPKYVRLDRIKKTNSKYNILFGKRSDGKSYAVQEEILNNFLATGEAGAIVRRYEEDFRSKRGATYFDNLACNGEGENVIRKKTRGEWDRILYDGGRWYLGKFSEELNRSVHSEVPLAYKFALTSTEHDKSTSYPTIKTIVFEEFMSRDCYLEDEFVLFLNTISTIKRNRSDVKIYMLANTVDLFCPYIDEMGLTSFRTMKPGDMAVYKCGEDGPQIAVEFTDTAKRDKEADSYFAFNNPKLRMITSGEFELPLHPHAPEKIKNDMIRFRFFIRFSDVMLQANIVRGTMGPFLFIHPKTSPFKETKKDLIYQQEPSVSPFVRRSFRSPIFPIEQKILFLVKTGKIFFSDNQTGEAFFRFCEQAGISA